ncbi:MAG TPA: hypothetical protein P5337_09795 [Aestuariivirga sp.]|nr:hypothetical protein [Aestuariivirga sp.]
MTKKPLLTEWITTTWKCVADAPNDKRNRPRLKPEEYPTAKRLSDEEHLYVGKHNDPLIEKDKITEGLESYFPIPPIWVGDKPSLEQELNFDADYYHEVQFERKLSCGIYVAALRDGTMAFDFTDSRIAPRITVPGYRKPNENGPYRIPEPTNRAIAKARHFRLIRAKVMNCHLALLDVAAKSGAFLPVLSSEVIIGDTVISEQRYAELYHHPRSLAQNVFNNTYMIDRKVPFPRKHVDLEAIERSFEQLDELVNAHDLGRILINGRQIG